MYITAGSLARRCTWLLAGLTLAACETSEIAGPLPGGPSNQTAPAPLPQEVSICHVNDLGMTANFSVSGTPAGVGNYTTGGSVDVVGSSNGNFDINLCERVWVAVDPADATVDLTIALAPGQSTLAVNQIVVFSGGSDTTIDNPTSPTVTLPVSFSSGAVVIFKTHKVTLPPPPPTKPGMEGCSATFWYGNTDAWPRPYTKDLKHKYAFGLALFGYKTLHQVLGLQGGGLNALGRETVAALLNSAHPEVSYYLKPAHVVLAFWWSGLTRRYHPVVGILEKLNNRTCPIA